MAGILDRLYQKLPVPLQHAAVTTFGIYWNRLRFGGTFAQEVSNFMQREKWDALEWHEYQQQKLRELLILAFTRVPYYRSAWEKIVSLKDLENFKVTDLQYLPPLEKAVARDDPHSLLVDGAPRRNHMVQHTSGSSGTPVAVYWLPNEIQRSLALREARACGFANVSYRMPRATFSGRIVVPDPNSNGPFHRYNLIEKQIYFSAFHLSPRSASQYIEALSAFGIVWLNGYSNSIYQLAMLAETLNIQAPQLKAVITTSEKLTYEMRQVVERVFNTHVYEEYGTVEDCFYVCENEHGEKLINPDAGILEVVDSQFRQVSPGIEGEVLATGFIRPYQPFIRYRIGDIASISESASSCGRQMPVLKEIVGRQEDTIYGSDGRRMVRFHGVFVDQPNIYEGQIIQESLQHIRVRIVPKPDFSKADEDSIRSRIQQRLTTDMVVSIDLSDHIERTSAGKFKAVVSNLSAEEKSKIANSI